MPREFHGLDVVSWREVDENPGHEVTRVYFLANNDKHVFVHKMLAQQSAASEGVLSRCCMIRRCSWCTGIWNDLMGRFLFRI